MKRPEYGDELGLGERIRGRPIDYMFDIDWHQFAAYSPEGVLLCVFLVSFLESLAFIGIVVPGVVLLVLLGSAALWVGIAVWPLVLSAFVGALLGDVLSFWLGAVRRDQLRQLRVWRRYQAWIDRGVRFVMRWGWFSVILGRFIGPIRPVVPVLLGAMGMPALRFLIVDVMACLVWAPVYVLPGYSINTLLQWLGV